MDEKVVIVGLGLIGGSLAKAFKKYTKAAVIGMDTDAEVLAAAEEAGAINRRGGDEDLQSADFVFLCVYPEAAVRFMEEHAHLLRPGCIVTDTAGIKGKICPALVELSKSHGFVFIGSHPMAGKERNGFDAADAELFQGASYILVPCGAPPEAVDRLSSLVLTLGFARTVLTTPDEHDRMIAFTSQLPHVLACAYVMSPCCPKHPGFSAGSYRDVSRVARINEKLWAELFLDNREALVGELDILIENITSIKRAAEQGDRQELEALLRRGREIKEALNE